MLTIADAVAVRVAVTDAVDCRPGLSKSMSKSKSRVPRKNRRKTVSEAKPHARGARSSWAVDEPFSAIVSIH